MLWRKGRRSDNVIDARGEGGAGGGGGDSGDDLIGDAEFAQVADLLADGAVQGGIAGMHAGYVEAAAMGLRE